jgi:hypothetical protein
MFQSFKRIAIMKTYTANSIAEQFETDRGVAVRALRGTKADAMVNGKPQWKIATAAAALEKHRAKNGSSTTTASGADPGLAGVFAAYDAKFDAMAALPSLDKRRAAAVKLAPLLAAMDRRTREVGIANGQPDELVHLRADQMFKLALRGFEGPTQWSLAECTQHLDAA